MLLSTPKIANSCALVNQSLGVATSQRLQQRLRTAVEQQNYDTAICLLDYLIDQDPKNPTHYSNRGLIYARCLQWDAAIVDYDQALLLNPDSDRIYMKRAKCNEALGQWDEAIIDYDCAIDINPYNIQARVNQGILFRDLKAYEDAIICFGLALFFGEFDSQIYAERGRTYHLDGHWNCAMGDYQRVLDILKDSPNADLEAQIYIWILELLSNR